MNPNENMPALLPAKTEFDMFQIIARNAQNSGLYGNTGGESKIFMVLLAARELGIAPMQALNGGLWNIQGKIEISARLMNSMIRRAGHTMEIKANDKECTIKGKRKDTGEEQAETFTIEMAQRAGLASRDVWKKYPEDMLYNRCMSRLARRLFPDVIGTAYVEGEIREAKEAEKNLPLAECEEITQETNQECCNSTQKTITEYVRINEKQVDALLDLQKLVTSKNIDDMWNHLHCQYGINSKNTIDIPSQAYERCENFLNLCIENNKRKQSAA